MILKLPPGLGTWAFGGDFYGNQLQSESLKTLMAAWDGGVRHFDTAPVYGRGTAEHLLGRFLKKKTGFTLGTKCFHRDLQSFQSSFEKSFNRLNLDFIDIFYIHWPDPKHPLGPVIDFLETQKAQGRIGALGVSNFSLADLKEALKWSKISWYQGGFNLLYRNLETQLFPFLQTNNILFEVYSPLAQGLLSGKYRGNKAPVFDGYRNSMVLYREENWPLVQEFLHKVQQLSRDSQIPMTRLSLAWVENHPGVSRTLLGPRSPTQVGDLLAPGTPVPQEIIEKLNTWSQEFNAQIPRYENIFDHKII